MPIRLEYIVSNSRGMELKRFDVKADAEAYDSVICAAEDISLLIQPMQKKLSLSDEQVDALSEHLAFHAEEIKNALKQIKKPKSATTAELVKDVSDAQRSPESSSKNSPKKKSTANKKT